MTNPRTIVHFFVYDGFTKCLSLDARSENYARGTGAASPAQIAKINRAAVLAGEPESTRSRRQP